MKKFFIYTCPCRKKMTCSVLSMKLGFSSSFSSLMTEDTDEELSSIFGIELLATQTNSNNGQAN